MTEPTRFFYATISGTSGSCFQLGPSVVFAPYDSNTLHIIEDTSTLIITNEIVGPVREFVAGDVEGRLRALGGCRA